MDRPLGFQEVEAPEFLDSKHRKVVRLSALSTGPSLPTGKIPGTHFCYNLSRPQGRNETERIKSLKNSNDSIGNRNRDLSACSAVPQPTAPPRTPPQKTHLSYSWANFSVFSRLKCLSRVIIICVTTISTSR
jgi:hypothetical protein